MSIGSGIVIQNPSTGGGGGTVTGAANGLHLNGAIAYLGGTLLENTEIVTGDFDFEIDGLRSSGTNWQLSAFDGLLRLEYLDGTSGQDTVLQYDMLGGVLSSSAPGGNEAQVVVNGNTAQLSFSDSVNGVFLLGVLPTGYFFGLTRTMGSVQMAWDLDIAGGLIYRVDLLTAGMGYFAPYLTNGVALYGQNYIPSLGDLSTLGLFNPPSTLTSQNNSALLDTPVYINPVAFNRLVAVSISILVHTMTVANLTVDINYQNGDNLNTTNRIATILNTDTIAIPVQTIYVFASGNVDVIVTPNGIGSVDYDVYASVQYLNVQN